MKTHHPEKNYWGSNSVKAPIHQLKAKTFEELYKNYIKNGVPSQYTRAEYHELPEEEQQGIKLSAYVTACSFREGTTRRLNENAEFLQLVVLDIDNPEEARAVLNLKDALKDQLNDLNIFVHTTISHTEEAPKLRVVVSVEECDLQYRKGLTRHVANLLGLTTPTLDADGNPTSQEQGYDSCSTVTSQAFFRPITFRNDTEGAIIASNTSGRDLTIEEVPADVFEEFCPEFIYSGELDFNDDLENLPILDLEMKWVEEALDHLDPDEADETGNTYTPWFKACCALRHQFRTEETAEQAFELFDAWSAKGEKYAGREATYRKWKSFTPCPKGRRPTTIRTLFKRAIKAGWDSSCLHSPNYNQENFPAGTLPPKWEKLVWNIAEHANVPPEMVFAEMLGVLGASVGGGLNINYRERLCYPNLYLLVVAPSGIGKGSSMRLVQAPLEEVQKKLSQDWTQKKRTLEAKLELAQSRYSGLKNLSKKGSLSEEQEIEFYSLQDTIDHLELELKTEVKVVIAEATDARLEVIASSQPHNAVAIFSPEARGIIKLIFGRLGNNQHGSEEHLYLSAYSAETYRTSRVSRDDVTIHPIFSLLLCVQPDLLWELFANKTMTESGLTPRFLLYVCNQRISAVPEEVIKLNQQLYNDYKALVVQLVEAYRSAESPISLDFDADAEREVWQRYNEVIESKDPHSAKHDSYIGRYGENLVKLCGILHIAKHGLEAPLFNIAVETAQKAIQVADWFQSQQKRVLNVSSKQAEEQLKMRLYTVLEQKEGRSEKLGVLKKSHTFKEEELLSLVQRNPSTFKLVQGQQSAKGGRPTTVISLHDS